MSRNKVEISRNDRLPSKYIKVGGIISVEGEDYKAVIRPVIDRPCNCCNGCDLKHKWCERLQCSKFDRVDRKNVWFVKVYEK